MLPRLLPLAPGRDEFMAMSARPHWNAALDLAVRHHPIPDRGLVDCLDRLARTARFHQSDGGTDFVTALGFRSPLTPEGRIRMHSRWIITISDPAATWEEFTDALHRTMRFLGPVQYDTATVYDAVALRAHEHLSNLPAHERLGFLVTDRFERCHP